MKTVGLLALGGAMGLKFEDLTYDNLRASFSKAVPKVYGNKNLDTAVIGNDYLPFYKWCDTNGDGSVALFESARCGSKSGFWYPSQVGWFDWATYATSISLEMAGIMMKYMGNIDRDNSMSLDQSEFAWHYAAMTHTSAKLLSIFLTKIRTENSPVTNSNSGVNSPNEELMFLSQKLVIMLNFLPAVE